MVLDSLLRVFPSEILGREELWNVLLCLPALFSVVLVVVLPFLPEAPRYLFIEKGDEMACQKGPCSESIKSHLQIHNTARKWFSDELQLTVNVCDQ